MNTPSVGLQVPILSRDAGTRELGSWGEELASRHLQSIGYQVLCRNWRCPSGELDIIARHPSRDTIVAIEVKTRRASSFVGAVEAISPVKLMRLRRLFGHWLQENAQGSASVAIDLVAVTVGDSGWFIRHVEDIA